MIRSALPAFAGALLAAGAAFAQQAAPGMPSLPPPKAALPGSPWAAPLIPKDAPSPMAAPAGPTAMTPERVRPPAHLLMDCAGAPKSAVTTVPEGLKGWATVYCTKNGHIFSPNDGFWSIYPGTKVRGALNAAELSGRKGPLGHSAHFTKIDFAPIAKEAAAPILAGATPEAAKVVRDKPLFRLDLTVDTGQTYSLVVADPGSELFWVIPLVDGKLGRAGFYVASLDYVNRKR